MQGQVFARALVRDPDGRPAGGFRGHHIDTVAKIHRQAGNARADKLHHPVFHIAAGVHRSADGQRHILRADARSRRAVQIHAHHLGTGDIISTPYQLLGQLSPALAHGQRAQRAIAGVRIAAQDHPAAAGHHLAVKAVNNRQVRRHIHTAVLARGGQGEHVVVLVDGAAHGAQAVVAVGQHIGHGKTRHPAGAGSLDDAHIGDIMAGQAVKAQAQLLHVAAVIMGLQNAVGHRALRGLRLRHGAAR